MADNLLFGHPYVHYTQLQLKVLLSKASVDYGDGTTKEALFHLAQAFEFTLPERSRRALECVDQKMGRWLRHILTSL